MKLVLDTHVLLWLLAEPDRLDAHARRPIQAGGDR
jgi:PIN domain nuclease of toxin-antitoxin system